MTQFKFFLDETGDHSLSFVDEAFPLFLLAGCLFEERELERIERAVNQLKEEFFQSSSVILHSREIRKCEGSFQVLFDLTKKQRFYERLNSILSSASFTIIGAGIRKDHFIKKYGSFADNPYSISLSFILERLTYCQKDQTAANVSIEIEKRGLREDRQLVDHYNKLLDVGTSYVTTDQLKQTINDFTFRAKKDNVIGLQIADLCAYPLARHVLNSQEPYIPYTVIESKIYCNYAGRIDGYGLKIFP